MIIQVRAAGDNLSLPIPKSLADQVGIGDDSSVDVSALNGKLVISPEVEGPHTLELLLAGITPSNLHDEVAVGGPLGVEAW